MSQNVVQTIGVVGEAASKERLRNRTILRVSAVAGTWGALLSWFLIVLTGDSLVEASHTLFWLLRILCVYLGSLAAWVVFNKVLYTVRGPSRLHAGEERGFDQDYFGRPVEVARNIDMRLGQHVVLAYENDRKIYRAPEESGTPAAEPAVAVGVRAMAAAVGQSSAPKRAAAPTVEPDEAHAGDL
ncbi:MAG: hypothetical protein H6509_09905 [Bryobacterales bacterium]|nr:hypothetical protein [Bryobacterales bacterium]